MNGSAQPTKRQPTARRRRSRQTRRSVLVANRAARVMITLGGVGTIGAVLLVCVFLVWVVIPLFLPASLTLQEREPLAGADTPTATTPHIVHVASDDYLNIGWALTSDGVLLGYRMDDGEVLSRRPLFKDRQPTADSFSLRDGHVAFGFADGSVSLGTIGFKTTFLQGDEVPAELQQLKSDAVANYRDGVVELTPEGQFRYERLQVELQDPVKAKTESAVVLIDQSVSSKGSIVALVTADGQLHIAQVRQRKNLLTGKVTSQLREGAVAVQLEGRELPSHLRLAGLGDSVVLAWPDGTLFRYDTRHISRPVLAEQLDVVPRAMDRLTALEFLNGKASLAVGDSAGRVGVWFRTKPADADTVDGAVLVKGHELPDRPAEVVALAPSPRSRMLAVAYADGTVRLLHVTSEEQLAEVSGSTKDSNIEALTISPKDDAVLAVAGDQLMLWSIDAPHPETTWASILRPVWYEGYNHPEDVWQSSSGTDDFEAKYGLVPLVFGTLKATFYSMLFGVPLALLAAVYTSEFLHPKAKTRIKPTIEVMASLPSVVLGFLAALVFAPMVEHIVPECLAALVTVPFAYLLGAYLWQLFPTTLVVRARQFRMIGMIAALPLGLVLAWLVGPLLQQQLFAGDIKAWLDGRVGSGTGGWMFMFLPLSAVAMVLVMGAKVTPALRRWAGHWSRSRFAVLDLAKFLAGCAATLALAYLASSLMNSVGWDPRGTFVDTYVQRNALVVGFIMGFAIIPIIYTISDDALSAVPESLRAGSLATGATRWQTAIRVVIPTAMSGLFSAIMIGLGRAVGETMIVLMAAGNTPVMDWNIFNGFRTLSANIAVELPEAVLNSTHYRMLFLAALSLFVMTFVVNTVAEIVRLRFRRRAFQL